MTSTSPPLPAARQHGPAGSRPAIRRLLVANRGEIACRVFATCRRLGIETVAVHSDADAALPFVREADLAVRLPGSTPAETYLRGDLLVEAAQRAGADAVHPGYGFLSENADFARAVVDAGLTWVGPAPAAIEAMGSKVEAKRIMAEAGVPVLRSVVPDEATVADLPLLVKASAGGGGRGMRVVRSLADLPVGIAAARAEAESAFGDGTVFVEPYVERGRHVEVQIWGDHHGHHVTVLGARDCSLQRRHQKLVEEAPPPGVDDATLEAMYAAAEAAGRAIGYSGVGTVEFLLDAAHLGRRVAAEEAGVDGACELPARFWFLEMNTRLQVEHPVTEAVTGLDLVELQIQAAEDPSMLGVSVGTGDPRRADGHAIEVRLYAEDPAVGHQPQSGVLETFDVPGVDVQFGAVPGNGLRLDAGYEAGNEVGTHYDAMLAKLICRAPTREQAARKLAGALSRARIHGPVTNRDLLVAALRHEAFLAGDLSTDFLDRHDLVRPEVDLEPAAFAAALMLAEHDRAARRVQRSVQVAWRNVVAQPQRTVLAHEGGELTVEWFGGRGYSHAARDLRVVSASPTSVVLEVEGVRSHYDGVKSSTGVGSPREVFVDGPLHSVRLREIPRFVDPADVVATGSLLAPMPGTVIGVPVEQGAVVSAGQPVLVLEAMKMQHTISAPADGVVEIAVAPGQQVAAGEVLAVVTRPQTPGGETP